MYNVTMLQYLKTSRSIEQARTNTHTHTHTHIHEILLTPVGIFLSHLFVFIIITVIE